jgi:carbon monoxide dehydrogenase subunit G
MIYHRRPTIFVPERGVNGDGDASLELTERFVVPAGVDRVWQLFDDVPQVVTCMPGAQVTGQIDDQTYEAQLAIAVGPIRPKFDVRAKIERDDATHQGRIHVDAIDKRGGSRARAQIVYTVTPEGDGSESAVELVQTVSLSGPLAQFGRTGVIEDINAQMTRQFAECLASKLGAPASNGSGQQAAAVHEGQAEQQAAAATPAPSNEIKVVPLLAKSVFGRFLKALRLRK